MKIATDTSEPILGIIAFGVTAVVIGIWKDLILGVGVGLVVYGVLGWRMSR